MHVAHLRQLLFGNIARFEVWGLSITLSLAGCYSSRTIDEEGEGEPAVALQPLIEDGPLPGPLTSQAEPAPAPPRSCPGAGGVVVFPPGLGGGLGGFFSGTVGGLIGAVGIPVAGGSSAVADSDLRGVEGPLDAGSGVEADAGAVGLPGGSGSSGGIGSIGGVVSTGGIGGVGSAGGIGGFGGTLGGVADIGGGSTGAVGTGGPGGIGSLGGLFGGATGGGVVDAGTGGDGDGADSCASTPIGFWRFDDCNASRSDLTDSSPQGTPPTAMSTWRARPVRKVKPSCWRAKETWCTPQTNLTLRSIAA